MFNNYAVVQGVDHVVPVDMYLPGCPPRPEMLIDAILKLHDQVQHTKLGANRLAEIEDHRGDRPQRPADPRDEGPDEVTRRTTDQPTPRRPLPGTEVDATSTMPENVPSPDSGSEQIGRRQGMFGVQRQRRHLRVRRPDPHRRAARRLRAAVRRLDGRRRQRAGRAHPRRRARGRGREGRRAPRRDHLLHRPPAPRRRGPAPARRRGAALRAALRGQRRALPRRPSAASCTPSTTCSR